MRCSFVVLRSLLTPAMTDAGPRSFPFWASELFNTIFSPHPPAHRSSCRVFQIVFRTLPVRPLLLFRNRRILLGPFPPERFPHVLVASPPTFRIEDKPHSFPLLYFLLERSIFSNPPDSPFRFAHFFAHLRQPGMASFVSNRRLSLPPPVPPSLLISRVY